MVELGLVERKVMERTSQRVVVRETWDLSVPGCPMIPVKGVLNYWTRDLLFTPEEYDFKFPTAPSPAAASPSSAPSGS